MEVKYLKRNIFQRLFGIPATRSVKNGGNWNVNDQIIEIELDSFEELSKPFGSLSFEFTDNRVLVIADKEGGFRAYRNYCTHGKRRLDPVPGTTSVQCCSMGKTTYDVSGNSIAGHEGTIKSYKTEKEDNILKIYLS